jgi:hypothetical protein
MQSNYQVKLCELTSQSLISHTKLSSSHYRRNEVNDKDFIKWKFNKSTTHPSKLIEVWRDGELVGRIALEPKNVMSSPRLATTVYLLTDLIVKKNIQDPRVILLLASEIRRLESKFPVVVFPNKISERLYQKFFRYNVITRQDISLYFVHSKAKFERSFVNIKMGVDGNIRPIGSSTFKRTLEDFEHRFLQVPVRKYSFSLVHNPVDECQTVLVFRKIGKIFSVQVDIISIKDTDAAMKMQLERVPRLFFAPSNLSSKLGVSLKTSAGELKIPNAFLPHEVIGYSSSEEFQLESHMQLSDIDVF